MRIMVVGPTSASISSRETKLQEIVGCDCTAKLASFGENYSLSWCK